MPHKVSLTGLFARKGGFTMTELVAILMEMFPDPDNTIIFLEGVETEFYRNQEFEWDGDRMTSTPMRVSPPSKARITVQLDYDKLMLAAMVAARKGDEIIKSYEKRRKVRGLVIPSDDESKS